MKLTNSVIGLLTIISWGAFALLYSILRPIVNQGGGCVGGQVRYTVEQCESLLGFDLPYWVQLGSETFVKASIIYGFFAAAVVCLACIIKRQKALASKT
ncbi:hypothetical protein ACWJ9U_004144 [Vibrio vulnificus]